MQPNIIIHNFAKQGSTESVVLKEALRIYKEHYNTNGNNMNEAPHGQPPTPGVVMGVMRNGTFYQSTEASNGDQQRGQMHSEEFLSDGYSTGRDSLSDNQLRMSVLSGRSSLLSLSSAQTMSNRSINSHISVDQQIPYLHRSGNNFSLASSQYSMNSSNRSLQSSIFSVQSTGNRSSNGAGNFRNSQSSLRSSMLSQQCTGNGSMQVDNGAGNFRNSQNSLRSSMFSQQGISNGSLQVDNGAGRNYQNPYMQESFSPDGYPNGQETFLPTNDRETFLPADVTENINTNNGQVFGSDVRQRMVSITSASPMASNLRSRMLQMPGNADARYFHRSAPPGSIDALSTSQYSQNSSRSLPEYDHGGNVSLSKNTYQESFLPNSDSNDEVGEETFLPTHAEEEEKEEAPTSNDQQLYASGTQPANSAHNESDTTKQAQKETNGDPNNQYLISGRGSKTTQNPLSKNRRVSFGTCATSSIVESETVPALNTLSSTKPPNVVDTGAMNHNWEKSNNAYLADFDNRPKGERRRSSILAQNYVKILETLDDDDDDDIDYDDDAGIEKRLREVARSFGGNPMHNQQRRERAKDKDSIRDSIRDSIAMDSLASSMRMSLNINDVFEEGASRRASRRSSRMSLCSRRSTRMSLILRQSFLDSFISDDGELDDQSKTKHQIPDVFTTKRNRRGSSITQSTTQLVSTVFGEEAAKIATADPKRGSFLLRGALEPVMPDELLMEICGMEDGDDFIAEDMHACQRNISQFVEAGIRDERRMVQNELRMNSINLEGGMQQKEDDDDLHNYFLESSMDLSISSCLTKTLRDHAEEARTGHAL